ncbi:MAG: glycosyltransferase, partial [Nanoarchaeota archaeon]
MKIAFNVLPLKSAHKDRGIGYYTQNLLEVLKQDQTLEIQEFTNISEVRRADVIHYPWFDFFFHSLSLKRPSPTVVTVHDVIPLKFAEHYPVGFRGKLNFILQKWALKSCKILITDSQASQRDIVKYLKIPLEKIEVIYLAADAQFKILPDAKLLYTKRKYKLPDQFLLYAGDANWVKNIPFLIRGFNEIIKSQNAAGLGLVLIGEVFLKKVERINHPELKSLKEVNRLIREYNLERKIIRPGKI